MGAEVVTVMKEGPWFGQMREDSMTELAALDHAPGRGSIVTVASAGCTAFTLAASGREVWAADINPAQTALCELKRGILSITSSAEEVLEKLEASGLQNSGRIDMRLMQLRTLAAMGGVGSGFLVKILEHGSASHEHEIAALIDGTRWRLAFRFAASAFALRRVFGREIAALIPPDAAAQLDQKMRSLLTSLPAKANPYAWQLLTGRYRSLTDSDLPWYLQRCNREAVRAGFQRITFVTEPVVDTLLLRVQAQSVGYCALSNIHEMMRPCDWPQLMAALKHALQPDAIIVWRGILTSPPTEWIANDSWRKDVRLSGDLSARDRSGLCNRVIVCRRSATTPNG